MKGIPTDVDGPKGEWYKRINEAVAAADRCHTEAELQDLLGPPDQIEITAYDDRMPAGETEPDPSYPEKYYVYRDPLRTRRTYHYGISDGLIVEISRVDGPVDSRGLERLS